jgi:hypothetical protein
MTAIETLATKVVRDSEPPLSKLKGILRCFYESRDGYWCTAS